MRALQTFNNIESPTLSLIDNWILSMWQGKYGFKYSIVVKWISQYNKGDYTLPQNQVLNIIDDDYYIEALSKNFLPVNDYNFIIFSNDIEYAKSHLEGDLIDKRLLESLLKELSNWDNTERIGIIKTNNYEQLLHPSQNILFESKKDYDNFQSKWVDKLKGDKGDYLLNCIKTLIGKKENGGDIT